MELLDLDVRYATFVMGCSTPIDTVQRLFLYSSHRTLPNNWLMLPKCRESAAAMPSYVNVLYRI